MHGSLPEAEYNELRADIKKKEAMCKSADTASTNFVPPDLADQLKRELEQSNAHITNEINGVVNRVQVAEFEADYVMMHQAARKQSVLMGTMDADMTVLSGDECIGFFEFMQEGHMTLQWDNAVVSGLPYRGETTFDFRPLFFAPISTMDFPHEVSPPRAEPWPK